MISRSYHVISHNWRSMWNKFWKDVSIWFKMNINLTLFHLNYNGNQGIQKNPTRAVLIKRCRENMSHVYWRRLMRRWDFNQVAKELYWNRTSSWVLPFTGVRPVTLVKKSIWHRCFPVNFTKFLRTLFFTEHLRWLLLSREA